MELRHLRYFIAVAESGSLTAAAAQLHISQPPLSVAMSRLEAELGVQLLERSHRGVEPTSAGRYLLDSASRVLGEVDDLVRMLGRFGTGMAGSIRIAAVPVLLWHRLPRALRAFAAATPEVEVSIVDPPPWTAMEMLDRGAVDLAAIVVAESARFIHRHRERYDMLDWGEIPLVAVLPEGPGTTPEAAARIPLSWFEGRDLLLPQRTAAVPSLPEVVTDALRERGVTPRSVRTTATIQTCLPLIEAGIGVAILPDPDRQSLGKYDVVVREIAPALEPLTALVLSSRDAADNPAVQRFLGELAGMRSDERARS